MVECDFCDEEFEGKEDLHIHWMEEHEDELNSHQEEKAKKAKREREERQKIRKEQRKKYIYYGVGGAVLLAIVGVLGVQMIPSGTPTTNGISIEGEPMIGNPDANVTVVEFGDFQCPACNRFEQGAFSRLKENYIDTGKIKFYWKDYPLEQLHPWARTAAETMECVYRQNETAFWKVKSTLFDNQRTITTGNVQDKIIGWAENQGVNGSQVRSCLQSGTPGAEVREDERQGAAAGVTGTPSIYVNGKKLDSFAYPVVRQAIEKELKN